PTDTALVGFERHPYAKLNPGLIGEFGEPALVIVIPAPGMGMKADLVPFLLENAKEPFVAAKGPVDPSVGDLNLGIHAHVPIEMDRILRRQLAAAAKTLHDLDQGLKTPPVRGVVSIRLKLIRFDVEIKDDRLFAQGEPLVDECVRCHAPLQAARAASSE